MSTGEAEPRALLGKKARRAGAVLAEMKIEADRGAADAERADQNRCDEILRRGRRQRGVEAHDDGAVEPGRRQQPQLVALAGEAGTARPAAAGTAADAARRSAPRPCGRARGRALAPRRSRRGGRDARRRNCRWRPRRRPAGRCRCPRAPPRATWKCLRRLYRACSSKYEVMVRRCRILSPAFRQERVFTRLTVSAPLTNFQINRLFNRPC